VYMSKIVHNGWQIDLIIRLPRSNAVKQHNFKRIYKIKIDIHTI
jgi:hypothetical protein